MKLACPACGRSLNAGLHCAGCGSKYKRQGGIPMLLPASLPLDMKRSIEAWNRQWAALKGPVLEERRLEYERDYLEDTVSQVLGCVDPSRHRDYLEIGCGPGFLGLELARRGYRVGGLDCCLEALKVAQKLYSRYGRKGDFVAGDLQHLPLADDSVDFLYGGGVIEHFEDTLGALKELHRILRPGGISFNTVPYVSVGAFTYRQLWGNIPDLPVIRPVFRWFHEKLLGGGHMKYGYEKSFTAARMVRLHRKAGFSKVQVRRFKVFLPFYYLPPVLRPMARRLCLTRPFWPMIAVVAEK